MFFITTKDGKPIAADKEFLDSFGVQNIFDIATLLHNGEIKIDELENSIIFEDESISFSKTKLSTLLGDLYLYGIAEEEISKNDAVDLLNVDLKDTNQITAEESDITLPEERSEISENDILGISDEQTIIDKNELVTPEKESEPTEAINVEDEKRGEILEIAEGIIPIAGTAALGKSIVENKEEIPHTNQDDDVFNLIDNDDTEKGIEPKEDENIDIHEDNKIFDLADNDKIQTENLQNNEIKHNEISIHEEEQEKTDDEEINHEEFSEQSDTEVEKYHIDTASISRQIGVSEDEYINFLNEFKAESTALRNDLESPDIRENKEAINTLKETSSLLMLSKITDKLDELSNATSDEKETIIDQYYGLLNSIETDSNNDLQMEVPGNEEAEEILDENRDVTDTTDSGVKVLSTDSIESEHKHFNLDEVEAIQFDFSVNVAANELALPSSLVSEFVIDFIEQAKENIPLLEEAYRDGDIDKIEKTAHLLKGASSNLRITPIADTLLELQTNKDIEAVPDLMKRFMGQLKALSNHMTQNA